MVCWLDEWDQSLKTTKKSDAEREWRAIAKIARGPRFEIQVCQAQESSVRQKWRSHRWHVKTRRHTSNILEASIKSKQDPSQELIK